MQTIPTLLEYDTRAHAFWAGLSREEKLLAFYSVTRRIFENDVRHEDMSFSDFVTSVAGDANTDAVVVATYAGYPEIHSALEG